MSNNCRLKFETEISDSTGSITATIFGTEAENIFNITTTEVKQTDPNVSPYNDNKNINLFKTQEEFLPKNTGYQPEILNAGSTVNHYETKTFKS